MALSIVRNDEDDSSTDAETEPEPTYEALWSAGSIVEVCGKLGLSGSAITFAIQESYRLYPYGEFIANDGNFGDYKMSIVAIAIVAEAQELSNGPLGRYTEDSRALLNRFLNKPDKMFGNDTPKWLLENGLSDLFARPIVWYWIRRLKMKQLWPGLHGRNMGPFQGDVFIPSPTNGTQTTLASVEQV